MDEVDIAQALQEAHLRTTLAAHAYAMATARGEAALACVACGEPIPERRRQAVPGCLFCVRCQGSREREGL